MSIDSTILAADFPKAVRGYAPEAVDRFVEEIGARLTALEAACAEQTERADRLAAEIAASEEELAAFRDKEKALACAMVATQELRSSVLAEIERLRASAKAEAEEITSKALTAAEDLALMARSDAETILAEARRQAEEEGARIRVEIQRQKQELEALRSDYQHALATIRRHLEDQLQRLTPLERSYSAAPELIAVA